MKILDQHISNALKEYGRKLVEHFKSDVISYMGIIHTTLLPQFIDFIENLSEKRLNNNRLVIFLTTPGGIVEAVEKMVEIIRYYYKEVIFVVPDAAMSAGTIWCMSGDKIFMDYSSSLGPVDPQVPREDSGLVPALGYIDKVNEFIEKSKRSELSAAEYILLKQLDLATLRRYEQARDLSISLLKKWLVKYKFKDWNVHRTNKPNTPVTRQEKEERAEQIAKALSDNNRWHSHGRMIGITTLKEILKIEIEDYSNETDLRYNIRAFHGLLSEVFEKQQLQLLLHDAGGMQI